MKKQILLSLMLMVILGCSSEKKSTTIRAKKININADSNRTNTYVVEYDFEKGTYINNNLQLEVHTPTIFKITNINRLAYNVTISSNDTILAETFIVDELEKSIKEATSENDKLLSKKSNDFKNTLKLDLSALNEREDFLEENKNREVTNSTFFKDLNKTQSINEMIYEKEKLTQEIKTKKLKIEYYKSERKKDSLKYLMLEEIITINTKTETLNVKATKDINIVILEITAKTDSINKNINKVDDLIAKLEVKSNNIINASDKIKSFVKKYNQDNIAFQEAFYDLNNVYKSILNLHDCFSDIKVVSDYPYMNKTKYQNEFKTKCYEKAKIILLQKETLIKFKDYFNQVGIKYSNLKYNPYLAEYLNYGGQTKVFAQADYLIELANKMNGEVNDINIAVTLQKMQHLLEFLEDDKVYQYFSAPIQPTQDAAIFKIKIQKKSDNQSDITDEKSFKHTEFTYGGTRLDFSLGLAASHFINAKIYEFGKKDNNTVIAKKEDNFTTASILGLMTMSYRRTQYLAYGASAGLGIDAVNGKIQLSNFFVGPTILFGKYDRIFLTGGFSFRNVGQLKSGYNEGDEIVIGTDDINKYLSDKYSLGGFLSLTYNLTKGVRANYKRLK